MKFLAIFFKTRMSKLTVGKIRTVMQDDTSEETFIELILDRFMENHFSTEAQISCCQKETLDVLFADSLGLKDYAVAVVSAFNNRNVLTAKTDKVC